MPHFRPFVEDAAAHAMRLLAPPWSPHVCDPELMAMATAADAVVAVIATRMAEYMVVVAVYRWFD